MEDNILYLCFAEDKIDQLVNQKDDIKEITEKKLNELYRENIGIDIKSRYENELNSILENKLENIYMLLYTITKKAKQDNQLVILRGTISSSLIAYLLGISYIDPIKYNIPFETDCGFDGNKNPDFELVFSTKYAPEIYQYVEFMFKENNLSFKNELEKIDTKILKLNFIQDDYLDILKKLEQTTGINCSDIDVQDRKIIDLFNKSIDTKGLMEFEDEKAKNIIQKVKPQTVEDMIKIVSLLHGIDVWKDNVEKLINEHSIDELLCSRDDIYTYLLERGINRKTAFEVMEFVGKGKLNRVINNKIKDKELYERFKAEWHKYKNILQQHKVPQWQINSFESIGYMFPKAHSANYTICSLWLAWYKIYYPNEFKNVME